MNDMITLFNQLTSSKLADFNVFAEIVDNHYEKFKYLYYMIGKLNLKKINTVLCDLNESSINVEITAKENKYINTIIFTINERKSEYKKSEYFDIDLCEENGVVILNISMNQDSKEGDLLYADRFI